MTDLPPGWEWTTIGNVADIQLGRQRSPKNHAGPHMRPYLRSANVTWSGIDVSDVKEMNFDPTEALTFELRPGDLLLNEASGSPNEVGKPAIWRGEIRGCCFQNTLLRVRPTQVSTAYMYWYCRASALTGRFGKAGRGVNIRHLGKQGLAAFPLPLPPPVEQERIVAAVEENLSRLDAAETALRSVASRTERLLVAARASAFTRPWPRKPLRDVAEAQLGKMLSAKSRTGVGSTPYLRNRNVRWGSVDLSDVAVMDFSDEERDRFKLASGDVLICEGGAGVGRTAIWRDELELCCYQKAIHRVRTGDELLPEFLLHFIRYLVETRRLEKHLSGVAIGHFPQEDLRALEVPVPSLEEQKRTLDLIGLQESLAEAVDAAVRTASAHTRALRRSILATAFSGQLVLHDDDEAASMLLDSIRAERAAATPSKRARRAKAS